MTRKTLFFIIANLLFLTKPYCQELIWKSGFHSFFDNREYFNNYAAPGSFLGARTFAEGGFSIDDNNSFSLGVNFLYEFGDEIRKDYIDPILYFHHNTDITQVLMGAFPRNGLLSMPYILQADTFQYYKPNVEGIFIQFRNTWGKQSAWLDWTSRQTMEARETFLVGATGELNLNYFYSRYDFIMYHYAGTASDAPDEHLRDNGGVTAVTGINLSQYTPFDSLIATTGIAFSYDRLRGVYDLKQYYGSISEVFAMYKRFGLRNALYVGEGQVNLVGDQMYTSAFYNRLDLILDVIKKGPVNGRVEFSLHFLPEVLDVSQKFSIYVELGGKKRVAPDI